MARASGVRTATLAWHACRRSAIQATRSLTCIARLSTTTRTNTRTATAVMVALQLALMNACNKSGWIYVCRCFVFFTEQNKCFLRSECELPQCEIGVSGEESYLFD